MITLSARPERSLGLVDGIMCDVMIEPETMGALFSNEYILTCVTNKTGFLSSKEN